MMAYEPPPHNICSKGAHLTSVLEPTQNALHRWSPYFLCLNDTIRIRIITSKMPFEISRDVFRERIGGQSKTIFSTCIFQTGGPHFPEFLDIGHRYFLQLWNCTVNFSAA